MKRILIALLVLQACSGRIETRAPGTGTLLNDTVIAKDTAISKHAPQCASCADFERDSLKTWTVEMDSCGNIILLRGAKIDSVRTVDEALKLLSKDWKIKLVRYKASHDTLFVRIKDAYLFTQRMGTTGANEFMLAVL